MGKCNFPFPHFFSHYFTHICIHTFGCLVCLLWFRLLTKFVKRSWVLHPWIRHIVLPSLHAAIFLPVLWWISCACLHRMVMRQWKDSHRHQACNVYLMVRMWKLWRWLCKAGNNTNRSKYIPQGDSWLWINHPSGHENLLGRRHLFRSHGDWCLSVLETTRTMPDYQTPPNPS